ncbi:hypothetical protein [Dactylosporangium sp. NPDC051541]|uniref:hypothetical protein n=1 Tax=Dactylosporangium sp. NPDC051541 TaxID=3363977 RepID=UPI0037A9415B
MNRRPLTLRQAVITTTALALGSTAGGIAEAIAAHVGQTGLGVGRVATAAASLWIYEKLDAIIGDAG